MPDKSLEKVVAALDDKLADTIAALQKIVDWADAYPRSAFPEPDWDKARAALATVDITLDAVYADAMRKALKGARKIASDGLNGQ